MENTDSRLFTPMYPWIFVRVLPREQKVGSIYMVEGPKQNKPMHEGIVLATWQPCQRPVKGKLVDLTPDVKPGDHVLFNHWAGLPVVGYNDKHFRIVKERDWASDKEGGIVGLVEPDVAPEVELANELVGIMDEHATLPAIAKEMLKRFIIIDRNKQSVTLSGL
jgi:co-chaperonin GroES (HSP10)